MLYVEWPRGATKELKYYQSVHDFVPIYRIKEILRHRYDAVVWSGGGLFPSRILFGEEVDESLLPCDYVSRYEDGKDAEFPQHAA